MGRNEKVPSYYIDKCDICQYICGEDTEGPLENCTACDNEICLHCCKIMVHHCSMPNCKYEQKEREEVFCDECVEGFKAQNPRHFYSRKEYKQLNK